MLFVIGLMTSVRCIAMCGGIDLSQCIPQTARGEQDDTGKLAMFRPALAYNMGRVLSYTAAGFVLGLAGFLIGGGNEVGLSIRLQGVLKLIAGLLMVIQYAGTFPLASQIHHPYAKVSRPENWIPAESSAISHSAASLFSYCGKKGDNWTSGQKDQTRIRAMASLMTIPLFL